jgi:D-beta-D-heptose 7-phosphate kinase/D-beta-D-heptose 1-phosphate adenosyltransferase
MIEDAANYGSVIVVANSDEWLTRKKGYCFMPYEERAEILYAIKGVGAVTFVDDSDGTVCEAIKRIEPTYFANGGDRKMTNTPEVELCNSIGVKLLWKIGGEKTQSSSELANNAVKALTE